MTQYVQFSRTDFTDGASEVLSIVKLDGSHELAVQITTGDGPSGHDFVGLYDLDGSLKPTISGLSWELAPETDVPADVIAAIEADWETGTTTVVRLP